MLEDRICLLVKFEGFNLIFEDNLSKTGSKSEAYELTEQEYYDAFGFNRYKNYDSFRVLRQRALRK